jgi:hypothetical protein
MTEQRVEPMTEQEYLGNAGHLHPRIVHPAGIEALPAANRQAYLPNGHRLPLQAVLRQDIEEALRDQIRAELAIGAEETSATLHAVSARLQSMPAATESNEPDLWLDTEEHTERALREIQDGNINAGIACLQAALAFAQNHRHSLSEETTR